MVVRITSLSRRCIMFVNATDANDTTTDLTADLTENTVNGPVSYRKVMGSWTALNGHQVYLWTDNRGDIFPGIFDDWSGRIDRLRWSRFVDLLHPEFPAIRRECTFVPTIWWEGAGYETCYYADQMWIRERGSEGGWWLANLPEFASVRCEQEREYFSQIEWEKEHLPE
jgi:hypothetical protein